MAPTSFDQWFAIHNAKSENKISEEKYFDEIQSVHSIHKRLIEEPDFIVGDLYYSSIKSLIINFSSTLEYFLKDSMKLNMMRNYSLLKKFWLIPKL